MAISVNLAGRLTQCVGAVALTLVAASAYAQSSGASPEMSTEELKSVYLDCEREAVAGRLDAGTTMQCSTFYEELKRRAFDGDFESMRTWSDAQRRATGTTASNFEI